jgi:hypothetical protein
MGRRSSAALSQPDAGSATFVRFDEFYASLFKRTLQCLQDGTPRLCRAALELSECHDTDLGRPSEIILSPIDNGSGGTALRWRHLTLIS